MRLRIVDRRLHTHAAAVSIGGSRSAHGMARPISVDAETSGVEIEKGPLSDSREQVASRVTRQCRQVGRWVPAWIVPQQGYGRVLLHMRDVPPVVGRPHVRPHSRHLIEPAHHVPHPRYKRMSDRASISVAVYQTIDQAKRAAFAVITDQLAKQRRT